MLEIHGDEIERYQDQVRSPYLERITKLQVAQYPGRDPQEEDGARGPLRKRGESPGDLD